VSIFIENFKVLRGLVCVSFGGVPYLCERMQARGRHARVCYWLKVIYVVVMSIVVVAMGVVIAGLVRNKMGQAGQIGQAKLNTDAKIELHEASIYLDQEFYEDVINCEDDESMANVEASEPASISSPNVTVSEFVFAMGMTLVWIVLMALVVFPTADNLGADRMRRNHQE
jgi:hypothetical protein